MAQSVLALLVMLAWAASLGIEPRLTLRDNLPVAIAIVITLTGPSMPSPHTLERFISTVESNAHVEAIKQFYAQHATMQENLQPPRVGRDALIEHERKALARAREVHSLCIRPVFQHGDLVVIRWVFEFDFHDGRSMRMEELAYQRWDGEQIVQEQFFYDPAQLQAKQADS
jgi:hypothetical protein